MFIIIRKFLYIHAYLFFTFYCILMYLETAKSCAPILLIGPNGKQTMFGALIYNSYNTVQDKTFY